MRVSGEYREFKFRLGELRKFFRGGDIELSVGGCGRFLRWGEGVLG